jgi:hypothetical protein
MSNQNNGISGRMQEFISLALALQGGNAIVEFANC